MRIYIDGSNEVGVARCPCDMYIIKGVGFLQYPTSNKDVAQAFADSWAVKRQLPSQETYDVDMSYREPNYSLCKSCSKGVTGNCEVYAQYEEGKSQKE